jgi:hypothetical protein
LICLLLLLLLLLLRDRDDRDAPAVEGRFLCLLFSRGRFLRTASKLYELLLLLDSGPGV